MEHAEEALPGFLGVVGEDYQVVQNEQVADMLDKLVDESGAHFETAGSLRGGRSVFVTMKLPESMKVAGVDDLDVSKLNLYLDDVWVAKNGGRHPSYQEADGQRVMKQSEITIRVKLARGNASATIWTCDLSHDYVTINADYRS